jgi:membrane associated rhomboid family serine protease
VVLQAAYLVPVKREPIFNVPGIIVALIGAFVAVHVLREDGLSDVDRTYFDLLFAFIPARYNTTVVPDDFLPGGLGAQIWTFVSYAFIHGNWTHLIVNSVWLLPFGSAIARRFGPLRFLAFFVVTAAGGALAYLAAHGGQESAVVGASAAISGTMAGAMRFMFQRGGPLGFWRERDDNAYRVPALPLSRTLREPRVLIFLIVWFAVNFLFGVIPLGPDQQPVAWEAHIGGFVAGLLLFSLFDPAQGESPAEEQL